MEVRWSNPLAIELLQLLQTQAEGFAIHHLVTALEQQCALPQLAENSSLGLFKKNFLVMNALFELQQQLFNEGLYLQISTLNIRILPQQQALAQDLLEGSQGELRAYYLDWDNYANTSAAEVEALLADFLRGSLSPDRRRRALDALELAADASPELIRRQYRRLVARHHPDRGGDPQRFIAIRGAWELLKSADC